MQINNTPIFQFFLSKRRSLQESIQYSLTAARFFLGIPNSFIVMDVIIVLGRYWSRVDQSSFIIYFITCVVK